MLEDKLYLSENVKRKAIELLDKVIKDDEIRLKVQGRKPTSIAASLVYIAARLEGEKIYQYELAYALNIIENTITKNYRNLMALLGMSNLIE